MMVVRVPETTRETTYIERSTFVERPIEQPVPVTQPVERHTDALPVVTPPPAQVIVITQPERTRDEPPVRTESAPNDDTRRTRPTRTHDPETDIPTVVLPPVQEQTVAPSPTTEEVKEFGSPNKKSSGEEQKFIPGPDKNNSETIPDENKNNSNPELFVPDKPASRATVPAYKKKGKVGRQRKYDELGENEIEPVREVILFRMHMGSHWPGMSKDMQDYYDYWYFEKPNKRKDGKDYERHLKCWNRKERWVNPTTNEQDATV